MARGPSLQEWYDRVPKKKEYLKSFSEIQYLEALRKAASRSFPTEDMTLKRVSKELGIPLKKLKQFMSVSPSGFTKDMALKFCEVIHVPQKILNNVGKSLFKEGQVEPNGSDANKAPVHETGSVTKPADVEKKKNFFETGPIDLDKLTGITLVNYMEETMFMVCHIEKDGTLKLSLIPNSTEPVNLNPYDGSPLLGERVVMIQAVPHSKKQVHLTEAHVPVRTAKAAGKQD